MIFHKQQSSRRLRRIRHSSLVDLARSRPATPEVLLQKNNITKLKSTCSVKAHDEGIVAVEFIKDPPTIVSASLDGRVALSVVRGQDDDASAYDLQFPAGILHEGIVEKEGRRRRMDILFLCTPQGNGRNSDACAKHNFRNQRQGLWTFL